ncbi:hypothetical protein RI129_001489 [Pyrocoelia pectoralis]|uniref:Prothoracicotropic hormone n=1 Tax=Pyrocoelia pectoralis TaxID=417401 RepID=A0AAN7VNB2_9COLE
MCSSTMNIVKLSKNVRNPLLLVIISSLMWINCQKLETPEWDAERNIEFSKAFDTFAEKPPCTAFNSIDDCEDGQDALMFNWLLKKRKEHIITKPFLTNKSSKAIRTIPIFQKKGLSCSCMAEPHMLELGLMYYPRRLPTVKCKPGGCLGGPYQCRPKEYRVHVLKQKQIEDLDRVDSNSMSIPHNLRDFFIPEEITITVACQCLP